MKLVHKGPSDILDLIIGGLCQECVLLFTFILYVRNVFYCLPLYFMSGMCSTVYVYTLKYKMVVFSKWAYQKGHDVHALPLVMHFHLSLPTKMFLNFHRPRDASTYKSHSPNSGLMTYLNILHCLQQLYV